MIPIRIRSSSSFRQCSRMIPCLHHRKTFLPMLLFLRTRPFPVRK